MIANGGAGGPPTTTISSRKGALAASKQSNGMLDANFARRPMNHGSSTNVTAHKEPPTAAKSSPTNLLRRKLLPSFRLTQQQQHPLNKDDITQQQHKDVPRR